MEHKTFICSFITNLCFMLIEFSVGNFKSFKDIQVLPMQAAKIKSKYPDVDKNNVFVAPNDTVLLKSKGVFGANASGKSNLIEAIIIFLRIVESSVKDERIISQTVKPYNLSSEINSSAPSFFQISFILEDTSYRYGFEVKEGLIVSEWLFGTPNEREVHYFVREDMDLEINKSRFKEGERLASLEIDDLTIFRSNSLFLGVVTAFGGKLSKKIMACLTANTTVITGIDDEIINQVSFNFFKNKDFRAKIVDMIRAADVGIQDLELIEGTQQDLSLDARKNLENVDVAAFILAKKRIYNEKGKPIGLYAFNLHEDEAEGTKKMFTLAPFVIKTLDNPNGGLLIIDELDARMHPLLSRKIVELFNSNQTNPNNAQLIFVTHDTNFLDAKLLRRDQITFVKRDKYGASSIYSLADYKGVRNDASFERDYLKGKYDAIPFLNEMDNLFLQNS
ncbi:MAG: AAA family ATPase [Chitinophagales bacterium]